MFFVGIPCRIGRRTANGPVFGIWIAQARGVQRDNLEWYAFIDNDTTQKEINRLAHVQSDTVQDPFACLLDDWYHSRLNGG